MLLIIAFSRQLAAQDKLLQVFHFNRLSMADGLPTDGIRARVVRDRKGFVWIGTVNGLERYDGYTVKDYRNVPGDPGSLPANSVMCLLVDRTGRLWVGTTESGLCLYDPSRDRFLNFLNRSDDSFGQRLRYIHAILEDGSGSIWVGTESEGVARLQVPVQAGPEALDKLVRDSRSEIYALGTPRNTAFDICERKDGKIIVASDSGLIIIDPTNHSLTSPHLTGPQAARLNTVDVYCAVQDRHGNTWAGTGTDGVFRIDWDAGRVENYRHQKGDSLSLRSDDVWDVAEDPRGNFWIATTEGIDLYSPGAGKRTPFLTFGSMPRGSIRMRLSVDSTGTLWIGTTQDGLYRLSPKSLRFPHYSMRGDNGWLQPFGPIDRDQDGRYWFSSEGKVFQIDLSTLEVVRTIDVFRGRKQKYSHYDNSTSLLDRRGNLWFGSSGLGLFKVSLPTGRIQNYAYPSPSGKEGIVWSIADGPGDTLWTASYYDGLMKFDPVSGIFQNVPLPLVMNVIADNAGRMWVATETAGLVVFDLATGRTQRYSQEPSDPGSVSHNRTVKIHQDRSGRIWVGAGNEIDLWDPDTKSFTHYSSPAWEREIEVRPLGTDSKGRVWVSHEGMSVLDPSSGALTDYDLSDGICDYVIDMHNLPDGRVLLSGSAGLNIVNPDSIDVHRPAPPLAITRISINDAPTIPPSLVNGSSAMQLTYEENVLEFEFAAIDIDAPQFVAYQYQLEGLEKEWISPRGRRFVRYPGLAPGEYHFRIKARSLRNAWPEQEIALAISIAPPWWKSSVAYVSYTLLFVSMFYTLYRFRLRQMKLRQEVQMKSFEANRLAEMDRLKSRFFANISHEFRTPLTLILGPLEKLRSKLADKETAHSLFVMERNAHQLLGLINQLLDLSRLEAGGMKLHASLSAIVPVVRGVAYSFESSAGLKQIELEVTAEPDEIQLYFDKEKVEKILTNLIANAFKFTHRGGRVTVTVTQDGAQNPIPHCGIAVRDTGIGIPGAEIPHVFERFYQVDSSHTREHEGSGIGLALVKELVDLHHGEISVQSVVGEGTEFIVRLPLGRNHLKDEEIVGTPQHVDIPEDRNEVPVINTIEEGKSDEASNQEADGQKPMILLVEDNADVSAYVREYLSDYQVLEARDGMEGTERALEAIPDLIISDIMMPRRDGYEMCRILKSDDKTSHIPIILLTAKATSEHKIEGLETGADDYLVKPFAPRELIARVKNLIELRRKLREHFDVRLRPGEVKVASMENEFLKKLIATVERRMGDEQFSVERLAAELTMSRMQLHRKVTALTNQSAGEFIQYMRLHRAMDLLKGNAGTVSEIAYSVGFNDPSHFTKRFQALFGVLPSEVRKPHA